MTLETDRSRRTEALPVAALVADLPATVPFVGPETQERARGRSFAARIGANESVFGPSPRAIEAMRAAAGDVWMYGDPEAFELRSALAERLGVGFDNVLTGEGIDGLLGYACRIFVEPGAAVVTSLGAYPTFNYHAVGYGGRLVFRDYRDDRPDLDALLDAARSENARLVYLANPDNPMGGWWPAADIERLLNALPPDCVLLLDEAYLETAPENTAPPIDIARPNLLRFRTFSKAMGLAGLRVGYVIGAAPTIREFHKIRNHFGLGRLAQAGALAALRDADWLAQCVAKIADSRARIARIASANALTPLASATNFVAIDCGADGALAKRVLQGLLDRDVFVRMPGVAPLDRCIRVSCGAPEDLDLFETALPDALAEARAA